MADFPPPDLKRIIADIQATYRDHSYPWVLGYSGGKDSTAALQLVWLAIAGLDPAERTKTVHVISTDTLVETPVIVDHVNGTLSKIDRAAAEQGMPFTTHLLSPTVEDSFWVNLIGKGYPAPTSIFRWCTDRLKIKPSNQFIQRQVSEHGEVILALGVRRGESATRDQVINMHRIAGKRLARHGQLHGAWVLMPIEEFAVDDVWRFLLTTRSPWGGDNRQLSNLYQSAQDGECPLVVDDLTSSCGNSRFGCWTCTVVERDKSMEAVIENGETWLTPLLEFRDWLAASQNPEVKPQTREFRGRNGQVRVSKAGNILWRTYTLDFCKDALRRLLETQRRVQEHDPTFELISEAELRTIRHLWRTERHDWGDSLPQIHAEATRAMWRWERDDAGSPGELEAEALIEAADRHGVPPDLMRQLVAAEWLHYGMRRRAQIHKKIAGVFNRDWRSLDEVRAAALAAVPGPDEVSSPDLTLEGETTAAGATV
ncbi:MAG TPA: DNA phosphorothioation system sulfurtransferase DndC [Rubricoccaceae bacterium]|jgi:DNA sulfur modification protein DndC